MTPQQAFRARWTELDRRWWQLDGEYLALTHQLASAAHAGDLYPRMERIHLQQDDLIGQMDVLLQEIADK
jgi:hypothetical protein